MSETKLKAHAVEVQFWATANQRYVDQDNPSTPFVRWACSCGRIGPAKLAIGGVRRVRTGGQRHVAAMERGR
jgi:hypothetical protein